MLFLFFLCDLSPHPFPECLEDPWAEQIFLSNLPFRSRDGLIDGFRFVGNFPTTPDQNISAKISRYKGTLDTNWWCKYHFLPRGGHTLAKYRNRYGRCIAALFRIIGGLGSPKSVPDLTFLPNDVTGHIAALLPMVATLLPHQRCPTSLTPTWSRWARRICSCKEALASLGIPLQDGCLWVWDVCERDPFRLSQQGAERYPYPRGQL